MNNNMAYITMRLIWDNINKDNNNIDKGDIYVDMDENDALVDNNNHDTWLS